ncbi:MAG: hypothetical protein C7B45_08850 [Sulfobacillus acidophilus]|uniref:Uncharacterized protein n=1 Tax=Sulfobacillus acidophilus TaxID=53633 RepID=A0A2T2WIC2_9FIRM|nr:MAG: hypothetical protein C7B45_08850 [Sulfobacillus acidophilus]
MTGGDQDRPETAVVQRDGAPLSPGGRGQDFHCVEALQIIRTILDHMNAMNPAHDAYLWGRRRSDQAASALCATLALSHGKIGPPRRFRQAFNPVGIVCREDAVGDMRDPMHCNGLAAITIVLGYESGVNYNDSDCRWPSSNQF